MSQIMHANNGIGLAGPQVGLQEKIFLTCDSPSSDLSLDKVYINPVITELFGDIERDREGCLSLPTMTVTVPRHSGVWIQYTDRLNRNRGEGYIGPQARCIQHEMDHLNGVLIFDHINSRVYKRLTMDKYLKNRGV